MGGCFKLDFRFSLSYGMAALIAESQHAEAWPASIYRHLSRRVISVFHVNECVGPF